MQEKTKAKLHDIAHPRPDQNATQNLRGSKRHRFKMLSCREQDETNYR